jgi:hypothetical protein
MMDGEHKFQDDRLVVRREVYGAGKKNRGGASFNIINMGYDGDNGGSRLRQIDNDALVRGLLRSKVLDTKNNGSYNILTGATRASVVVPAHQRYNPLMQQAPSSVGSRAISNVGREVVAASNHSRKTIS